MAATYSTSIAMPAQCVLIPQEEMVYLEGGAWMSITKQDAINFGINFAHNAVLMIGSISLSAGTQALTNAIKTTGSLSGGLTSIWGTVSGFNGWQVAALVGCGACATYYVVVQTIQIVSLVSAVAGALKQAYDMTVEQSQQAALAAA